MLSTESCLNGSSYALDAYELKTRSIRIHGAVTSVGLENFCWDVLSYVAHQNALTTNQQLVQLHDRYLSGRTGAGNFSSFLRVYCLQFIAQRLEERGGTLITSRRYVPVHDGQIS